MINGFKVTDAHCHIYPEKIASKAVAGTDAFYNTIAAGKGTVPDLETMGKTAGIDNYIVHSVATTPKQVSSINNFIAKSVLESEGKFTGLGALHPDSEDIEADVKEILSLSLHGVKLHPDIQRFPLDSENSMKMFELCEYYKLPVLIHTGDYRYDFSNPNRLEPILKTFKNLTVIGAHLGGWSMWDEASEKLSKYENLFVDCSSTFPFIGDVKKAISAMNRYGADRIMFGSDYPMWSPEKELATFMSIPLTDADRKKILSENAIRIYNI